MDQKYKVTMDDGTGYEVVADQRDVAKWEIMPFGTSWEMASTRLFTYSRFCAWNASRRAKRTTETWDDWNEQCKLVEGVDEETMPDPGQPAVSAGT
jgi:hypothetical protein